MEDNHQKFLRLATARTNKVLDTFRLLENLSNKSNYQYSDEEVDKIFKAIDAELRECKKMFSKSSLKKNSKFEI